MLSGDGVYVLVSTDKDRISPVLDATGSFVLVNGSADGPRTRRQVLIPDTDPISKARRIVGLGARILICGAISWPMEAMLTSSGMSVIANTCGEVDEVLAAHFSGGLTERAFLMPGCPGRRHRHRYRGGRGSRDGGQRNSNA